MEERDNTNENIIYPLPYGLKSFITRELQKITQDTNEPLAIFERTVQDSSDLYNDLLSNLEPILKEDTKPFVNKIIQYKKRICRDGINCKRGNTCIFNHPAKSKSYADNYEKKYPEKRQKYMKEANELNEVILNNVPKSVDEEELRAYCEQFGFCNIKKLKDTKVLLCFRTHEEAKGFLHAKEFVLDDENIKKYYNRNKKVDEDDLEQLFEDLEEQMGVIRSETNHEGFKRLNWIANRIKSVVIKKNNSRDNNFRDNNPREFNPRDNNPREKNSLLCNSNFVME